MCECEALKITFDDAEFYKCVNFIIPNDTKSRKLVSNRTVESIDGMLRVLLGIDKKKN